MEIVPTFNCDPITTMRSILHGCLGNRGRFRGSEQSSKIAFDTFHLARSRGHCCITFDVGPSTC